LLFALDFFDVPPDKLTDNDARLVATVQLGETLIITLEKDDGMCFVFPRVEVSCRFQPMCSPNR
jgi:hypothetical protein